MENLTERAVRGGFARLFSQGATFALRLGSLMVLARLLNPTDFGLVGMVTAFTGILGLFRDFGLSAAAVQRPNVTEGQISTLFWVNTGVGSILMLIGMGSAPLIARFYHQPHLYALMMVMSLAFLFNAAGVQHSALLQRGMHFKALSVIDITSLVISIAIGITMAILGFGYWALAATTLVPPFFYTLGVWICARWVPGRPRGEAGIRSLMRFGGTITLNGMVTYFAYNSEKVLLGRFWGANAVGIYGRAYQLINIPTENLNSAVGEVAFSALSRVQHEPHRLRNYFLKGYALVLGFTLPATLICAIFAPDIIGVVLGPKWEDAAIIFRLLSPTIAIFAMINPFSWLLFATGRVERSLKIALTMAPLIITGYACGLPYGPKGVAIGYSTAMALWVVPHIAWSIRGTPVTAMEILHVIRRPFTAGLVAALFTLTLQHFYGPRFSSLPRLTLGVALFLCAYLWLLLEIMGQKDLYLKILQTLRHRAPESEQELVPA